MKLYLENKKDVNNSLMIDLDEIKEFFNYKSSYVVFYKDDRKHFFSKTEWNFTLYNRPLP